MQHAQSQVTSTQNFPSKSICDQSSGSPHLASKPLNPGKRSRASDSEDSEDTLVSNDLRSNCPELVGSQPKHLQRARVELEEVAWACFQRCFLARLFSVVCLVFFVDSQLLQNFTISSFLFSHIATVMLCVRVLWRCGFLAVLCR